MLHQQTAATLLAEARRRRARYLIAVTVARYEANARIRVGLASPTSASFLQEITGLGEQTDHLVELVAERGEPAPALSR
jgi:hypothetical protein